MRGYPIQCIPIFGVMRDVNEISPIWISIADCGIIPKCFPVLIVNITLLLILRISSYLDHCILIQKRREWMFPLLKTWHIWIYPGWSWWQWDWIEMRYSSIEGRGVVGEREGVGGSLLWWNKVLRSVPQIHWNASMNYGLISFVVVVINNYCPPSWSLITGEESSESYSYFLIA